MPRISIGDRDGIAAPIENFAFLSFARDKLERSAMLCAFAEKIREELAAPLPPVIQADYDAMTAGLSIRLSQTLRNRLRAEGCSLKQHRAVELALSIQSSPKPLPIHQPNRRTI